MLRLHEVRNAGALAAQLMLNPSDEHLSELFTLVVEHQSTRVFLAADPFHGEYPQVGCLSHVTAGDFPLCAMPTGDTFYMPVSHFRRNVIVVGPTGLGKTNAAQGMTA